MPDFGSFRGFGEKLVQGQTPTQLGKIGTENFGFDVESAAFFARVVAAGGTLSETEQLATDTLVKQMKVYGLWDLTKAIYPMVGASAAACAQNLKSSSFTGSFSTGWTFASTGATPNGSSAFMDTGLNALNTLTNRNLHLAYYARAGSDSRELTLIGTMAGLTPQYNVYNSTRAYASLGGNYTDASIGAQLCFHTITSLDGSTSGQRLYTNGILRGSSTNNSASLPSTNFALARGYQYSPFQCALASIGDGLTATQASDFYTIVQEFQTTLSRQI